MKLIHSIKRHRYLSECSQEKQMSAFDSIISFLYSLYTFLAFLLACCATPFLFAFYLCTQSCRRLCFSWLESKYPQLEFVKQMTVRTVVDTHRNQGIITVLLHINSPCQINYVKNRIQGDIISRSENGKVVFPHLRTVLTSRWGCYAWVKGSHKKFDLNNHILLLNSLFKGRPVNDSNIQEYVTDIVSKLLPPEYPPWQISLIPSTGEKSYLLIRLHHLYLSEDNLSLGDLLMLKEESYWSDCSDHSASLRHLMSGTFKNPMVLMRIYDQFSESLANHWNEYVSLYDPVENPSILKMPKKMTLFFHLFVITSGNTAREWYKGRGNLTDLFMREAEKRNLDTKMFLRCYLNSMEPLNLLVGYVRWVWWTVGKMFRTPVVIMKLFRESPVFLYWLYLVNFAVQEICYVFRTLYEVPRVLLEEIFLPEHPCNVHNLQTLSLCGRKVVGWSEVVPMELLKRISEATGASTGEIALSAAAASLRDYFEREGYSPPDCVVTTSRFMSLEQLLARSVQPACGQLCLPLPTDTPHSDPLRSLRSLQESLKRSRSEQAVLYLASLYRLDHSLFTSIFPTIFARACLYLLSRRYSVTLTQVESTSSEPKKRQLLWGPEVEKMMYWRPPQANICVSLTLISYHDGIQLGVMADALLSPHHNYIAESFSSYLEQLGEKLMIPKTLYKPLRDRQEEQFENQEVVTSS